MFLFSVMYDDHLRPGYSVARPAYGTSIDIRERGLIVEPVTGGVLTIPLSRHPKITVFDAIVFQGGPLAGEAMQKNGDQAYPPVLYVRSVGRGRAEFAYNFLVPAPMGEEEFVACSNDYDPTRRYEYLLEQPDTYVCKT